MKKALLLVLILTGCAMAPQADTQGKTGGEMLIDSRNVKTWNVRKRDFWTLEKKILLRDIKRSISEYLLDGYEIVDAPTSGTINLNALTIAGKKALVIWRAAPVGTININIANTMSDSAGALDSVVILGAQLDAQNQLENAAFYSTILDLKIQGAAGGSGTDYGDRLILDQVYAQLAPISVFNGWYNQMIIKNSIITINYYEFRVYNSDFINNHVTLSTASGGIFGLLGNANSIRVENNVFIQADTADQGLTIAPNTDNSTFLNNYVYTCNFDITYYTTNTITINNILLVDCVGDYLNGNSSELNYINVVNSTPTASTTNKSLSVIKQWSGDFSQGQIYTGKDTLNLTEIRTLTNYILLNAIHTEKRKSVRKQLGTIKRQYMDVNFLPDRTVDPLLKFFDDNDYQVKHRTEEDAALVTVAGGAKKIISLELYDFDGTTLFDYRNDQNFLILATDSLGNDAVFAWYKGKLHETVYTDTWDSETYIIDMCIQIGRPPTDAALRNIHPVSNSSLTGNISYQDITSIVIIP